MEDVIIDCPVCKRPMQHALLKATPHSITVRCKECDDVRTMSPPQMKTLELKLVVSHAGEAWSDRIEVPSDEEIEVGFEFELNDHRMIVTGLEFPEGKADKGLARDIKVLHAKVFDTVPLKLSVNEGDITKSFRLDVDPDRPVQIGEVVRADGRLLLIKTLKSDQNRTLHKGGLPARNVVRAFCDPAPLRAREGQVMTTRPRGRAKPGAPRTTFGPGPRGSKHSTTSARKSSGAGPTRKTAAASGGGRSKAGSPGGAPKPAGGPRGRAGPGSAHGGKSGASGPRAPRRR